MKSRAYLEHGRPDFPSVDFHGYIALRQKVPKVSPMEQFCGWFYPTMSE